MEKLRPFLTAALGLMLWVQGMAMAAAPVAVAQEPAGIEMPCHGDEAPAADACACCDDACPDMASCVIGHYAGAPASAIQLAAAPQTVLPAAGWSPQTSVLPLPLRPPIVTHG